MIKKLKSEKEASVKEREIEKGLEKQRNNNISLSKWSRNGNRCTLKILKAKANNKVFLFSLCKLLIVIKIFLLIFSFSNVKLKKALLPEN